MAAVSLRLPDDVANRLAHLSANTGRSKTFYMLEAINTHLAELEEAYLAEERLRQYQAGQDDAVSLDKLMQRYDMAN